MESPRTFARSFWKMRERTERRSRRVGSTAHSSMKRSISPSSCRCSLPHSLRPQGERNQADNLISSIFADAAVREQGRRRAQRGAAAAQQGACPELRGPAWARSLLSSTAGDFILQVQAEKRVLKASRPQQSLLAKKLLLQLQEHPTSCPTWLLLPTELLVGGREQKHGCTHPSASPCLSCGLPALAVFLPFWNRTRYLLSAPYRVFHNRVPEHFKSKLIDSGITSAG